MKNILAYTLFIVLVVYHLLPRTWWTPILFYVGTYGMLLSLFYERYKNTKCKIKRTNIILMASYFSFIFLYALSAINEDTKEFYKAIHLRTWALGIGGSAIVLLMLIRREE